MPVTVREAPEMDFHSHIGFNLDGVLEGPAGTVIDSNPATVEVPWASTFSFTPSRSMSVPKSSPFLSNC